MSMMLTAPSGKFVVNFVVTVASLGVLAMLMRLSASQVHSMCMAEDVAQQHRQCM